MHSGNLNLFWWALEGQKRLMLLCFLLFACILSSITWFIFHILHKYGMQYFYIVYSRHSLDIYYRLHTNKCNILYGYDREKLPSSKEAIKTGSQNTKDRVTQYHEFKIEKTASVSDSLKNFCSKSLQKVRRWGAGLVFYSAFGQSMGSSREISTVNIHTFPWEFSLTMTAKC